MNTDASVIVPDILLRQRPDGQWTVRVGEGAIPELFATPYEALLAAAPAQAAPDKKAEHYAGKYEALLCEALELCDSNDLETHSASADAWIERLREAMDFTKPCTAPRLSSDGGAQGGPDAEGGEAAGAELEPLAAKWRELANRDSSHALSEYRASAQTYARCAEQLTNALHRITTPAPTPPGGGADALTIVADWADRLDALDATRKALATTREGVVVDEAVIARARKAWDAHQFDGDENAAMRAALTAALQPQPPTPKEKDRG